MARIGLIQVDDRVPPRVRESHDHMYALMEGCMSQGADITLMPEGFQYLMKPAHEHAPDALKSAAEAWRDRLAGLAQRYHAYVMGWDMAYRPDGKLINYCYILDRHGEEAGRHVKVHIPFGEAFVGVAGGDRFEAFDTDFGRVGMLICFDNYYPEAARMLQLSGAQLVLYPLYGDTLWGGWELKLRARALDYSMYFAPCQLADPSGPAFTGLVDPEGDIVCRMKERGTFCVTDAQLDKKIITHTSGDERISEDIKQYLLRQRVPAAYKGIDAAYPVKPWEEILSR